MSIIVVPYGHARRIIRVAIGAGAKGATILHARGVEKSKKEGFFHFSIEPEQEIVLIVATKEVTDAIGEKISHVDAVAVRRCSIIHFTGKRAGFIYQLNG